MKLYFDFLQELRLKFKLVQKTIINQQSFYASPLNSSGQVLSRGSCALRTCQSNSCSDDSNRIGRTWPDQCKGSISQVDFLPSTSLTVLRRIYYVSGMSAFFSNVSPYRQFR